MTGDLSASASAKLTAPIWTLAGGYSLAAGAWGNVDFIAGFRYAALNTRVNYSLGAIIEGPRGNGATFGGIGYVTGRGDIWNGIGGFRGRFLIPNSQFFVPYYFDIGGGGSKLTWQIASGIGYHFGLVDASLTYCYMTFEQNSSAEIQRVSINGPLLTAGFRF